MIDGVIEHKKQKGKSLRLFKEVYIYFLSYFINAGLSFLTVSVLTHYLTTYDYGIINLYSSFLIFLMPFVSGGIMFPISVEYFKRTPEQYKIFFTNAQVIPIISLFLFTLLCFIFQHPLGQLLKVSAVWIWIMPLSVWWIMINEAVMMICRSRSKATLFLLFSVGKNVAEILLTIGLVIGLHWAWQGRLLSAAVAPTLLGIFCIYLFYRWHLIADSINKSVIRKIVLSSLPFIFERLAIFVLGYSDKYFIDRFDSKGTDEVGLYGLGSQIASIIYMVIISLNSAYYPHIFKTLAGGLKNKFDRTTGWYIGGLAITIGAIFIAIPLLFRFFIGGKFQDAQPYAYLLSAGYFMWGVYNALLGYLLYLSKNRQIFIISLVGMVASLSLNALMVPVYGATGAAITSIVIYSLMAGMCFMYVRKYFLLQ